MTKGSRTDQWGGVARKGGLYPEADRWYVACFVFSCLRAWNLWFAVRSWVTIAAPATGMYFSA
ncbi:MAG: hypothetical protein ACI9Y1_002261 [Lentisphaeria bacterium]|jgi:hypothetical protein